MKVQEAVRATKELLNQFQGLAKVNEALTLLEGGDAKIEELLNRKAGLDAAISSSKVELQKVQSDVAARIAAETKRADTELSEIKKKVSDQQAVLDKLRTDTSAQIMQSKVSLKEETARLLSERKQQSTELDKQIEAKRTQLNSLQNAINSLREKVMS